MVGVAQLSLCFSNMVTVAPDDGRGPLVGRLDDNLRCRHSPPERAEGCSLLPCQVVPRSSWWRSAYLLSNSLDVCLESGLPVFRRGPSLVSWLEWLRLWILSFRVAVVEELLEAKAFFFRLWILSFRVAVVEELLEAKAFFFLGCGSSPSESLSWKNSLRRRRNGHGHSDGPLLCQHLHGPA